MPTVYVINKGPFDYHPAEEYGKLKFVTEANIPKFNTDLQLSLIQKGLKDISESDFLILGGPLTLSTIACVHMYQHTGKLRILLFRQNEYILREVVI